MVTKGRKKGTYRFSVQPGGGVRSVLLAGEFNDWNPQPMRKGKAGEFVAIVALEEGTYEYKFVMDGEWRTDPDSNTWAMNPYGTMNSVVSAD